MFGFDDPIYTLSAAALIGLAIFGAYEAFMSLRHKRTLRRRHQVVLKISPTKLGEDLATFIKSLPTPFTLEVAIHQLGKTKSYYLVLPKHRADKLAGLPGIERLREDYHIFHSGGAHLGAYFKGSELWPDIDFKKVSFSKINEVGEGATIQYVFKKRRRKSVLVNMRVVVSAPSTSEAKEILAPIKKSLSYFTAIDASSEEFIQALNSRKFNAEEAMNWKLAT